MPLRIYLTGRVLVEESGTALLDERCFMGRQGRLAFAYLIGDYLHQPLIASCLARPLIW